MDTDASGLENVVLMLHAQTGHDFSLYKQSTIYRRIARRMALHQLEKVADYLCFMHANTHEVDLLFKELLIGVTSFFRDPEVWAQLQAEVIPALLAARPEGGTVRAWVPACSTGEEAYSLAMVFRQALAQARPMVCYDLQVFATDLDSAAIDKARTGVYPSSISAEVPEALLRRYFTQDKGSYRVGKEVRDMVIFAPQNLVMDPPFTKLDLLSCRNLLIYLHASLQEKLLPLLHYSLNPGGVLVLGSAETVGNASELFAPVQGNNRIYRRRETRQRPDRVKFPTSLSTNVANRATQVLPAGKPVANLQALTDALLLQRFTPAAVLATEKGDIVYISGRTGSYLEPAAGTVNHNLFAMARAGLAAPLFEAFDRAVRQGNAVELKNIAVDTNSGTKAVDITVQPLAEPAALRAMVLVVFVDVAAGRVGADALAEAPKSGEQPHQTATLARELQHARAALHTTREAMQAAHEALKTTNEALQSTNDELQSANEQLGTSKEEMRAMNEALQTVNHELNAKVGALSQARDDMKNLLNSIGIATLFLDNALKVRRFTSQATPIFNLIASDAGRPIADLVSALNYPELVTHAAEVLRSLVFHEVQVSAKDGRWFAVRTTPYRTQDHRIDGVVITFTDISVAKSLEKRASSLATVLQRGKGP